MRQALKPLVSVAATVALVVPASQASAALPGGEPPTPSSSPRSAAPPTDSYLPLLNDSFTGDATDKLTNFVNMYSPQVVYDPDGDPDHPYKMWFFGWANDVCNTGSDGCDAIFHARGADLDTWEVYAGNGSWDATMTPSLWEPVLTADPTSPWDSYHVGDASVVEKDGVFYMAYSGYGADLDLTQSWEAGDSDGDILTIMGASSTDGINWTRTDEPILVWEPEVGEEEHLTERYSGSPDFPSFYGDYHRPSIMWDEAANTWKIWFDMWDPSITYISTGYGENSGDFMDTDSWTVERGGDDPVLEYWPNPDVVKIGSLYLLYGDPDVSRHDADPTLIPDDDPAWSPRQITEAVSTDGINWTTTGWMLPDSDSAANQIPVAFEQDDELYLWYATQIGGDPYSYYQDAIRSTKRNSSPADVLTDRLVTTIGDLDAPPGIKQSLLSKADNASEAWDTGNFESATRRMEALVRQVKAQQGRGLTAAQATTLVALAKLVVASITSLDLR